MKILIANRGEIAVRIIRACREMALRCVAVYSDCDRAAPHVRLADEAYPLGADAAAQSYLNIQKLVDTARRAGATAVHPGYGFLSENDAFARACVEAGLTFIGPSPDVIVKMGSKTAAREVAARAGVPVVPGTRQPLDENCSEAEIMATASEIGFPLFVKAVAGGGGRGMRLATAPADLLAAVRMARSEAGAAFGRSAVYLERQLKNPRHVEIQLLGDEHGTVVPFVERECSIQRRHQKVLEESPSPAVSLELRQQMASAAAAVGRAVGYTNAGTIEFLLDQDGRFYFLEMNTRLQVEHPITELTTGVDLVQWQIRIARGERLDLDQTLTPRGHAIECRIYAEDPDRNFMPSPGRVGSLRVPAGPGIREDSGISVGFDIPLHYDSMISKLISWAGDRPSALARMTRALDEYEIGGVQTTLPFFRWLLRQPFFAEARFDTTSLDALLAERAGQSFVGSDEHRDDVALIAIALDARARAAKGVSDASASPPVSAWKHAARVEGLRR